MLDLNIINAAGVAILVVILIKYIIPFFNKKDIDYYDEIRLGLMLFGYAFRDEKVKQISDTVLALVTQIENLRVAPDEKHAIAADKAIRTLSGEFGININPEAMDLIIQLAVARLPKTN